MSRNSIIILVYHRHKFLDLIYGLYSEGIGFESEAEPNSASWRMLKYITTDFAPFHSPAVSWQKLNTRQSVSNCRMEMKSFNDVSCRVCYYCLSPSLRKLQTRN
jgi:hypothetical protein